MGLFDLGGGSGNSNPMLQSILSGSSGAPASGPLSGLTNGLKMYALVQALRNKQAQPNQQKPLAPTNPLAPNNGPQSNQGLLSRIYNGITGGNSAPYYTANGPSQTPPQGIQYPTIPASAPAAPAAAPPAPMGAVDNGNFNIPTMPGALMGGNIPNY